MKKIIVFVLLIGIFVPLGLTISQTKVVSNLISEVIARFRHKPEEGVIVVSGNVEITDVDVGFTLSGRVLEMLAEEGQEVQKDDKLATLDSAELESVVAQNKAVLDEALAQLDDLKTGARTQEIGGAEANVKAVEAELSRAKKDFERANALYKENLVPASQLDAARSAYTAALAKHKQVLEQLSLVKEGPTKNAVQAAEFRVEQAKAALQASQERLKNTVIYAPMSGVILKKNVEIGEIVTSGLPIYTIGDLEHPWIKVYVKEARLGLVKLGQQAQITIDSYPDKVYEGTVTFISSEAEFTPKTVQTQEERVKLVFGVKISVQNVNGDLKPGMPADVKILLQ
jgi:HlyD family secretion protein